jgi:murein DD-endopeptidase MepM/ murein hydrolase activator NlpD
MKFLLLLILASCASMNVEEQKLVKELQAVKPSKMTIYPGKVKFVELNLPGPDRSEKILCGEVEKKIYIKKGVGRFYLVESYFSEKKSVDCFLRGDKRFHVVKAQVKPFPYKSEKLRVARKRVVLSPEDQKRVEKEWLIKKEIYEDSSDAYLYSTHFVRPLDSYVTSWYGTRRTFNGIRQGQHLGNDLRARTGVKIPVANKGKVVFVGDLFYSGGTVIVDHGRNIFTMYGHLSKILVSKGDVLQQKDIVGLAGATGRVSGPHLHWGVRIDGHWVDGFSLVEESKKQFQVNDGA